jgi:hypothetical protein
MTWRSSGASDRLALSHDAGDSARKPRMGLVRRVGGAWGGRMAPPDLRLRAVPSRERQKLAGHSGRPAATSRSPAVAFLGLEVARGLPGRCVARGRGGSWRARGSRPSRAAAGPPNGRGGPAGHGVERRECGATGHDPRLFTTRDHGRPSPNHSGSSIRTGHGTAPAARHWGRRGPVTLDVDPRPPHARHVDPERRSAPPAASQPGSRLQLGPHPRHNVLSVRQGHSEAPL